MLNCIIKYMSGVSDAHTIVKKKDNIWFPIRFKVINDNVYIDRCFDKKYLRKKIIKVNNVDINKVIVQIEKCTSYGTKGWLEINIEDKSLKNLIILEYQSPLFKRSTYYFLNALDSKKKEKQIPKIKNQKYKYIEIDAGGSDEFLKDGDSFEIVQPAIVLQEVIDRLITLVGNNKKTKDVKENENE